MRVEAFGVEATSKTPCRRPAPGNRYSHMGTLHYNGNYGYSYSCSANETNGMFLDFNTQGLNSSGGYDRAHGLQLRCLSE